MSMSISGSSQLSLLYQLFRQEGTSQGAAASGNSASSQTTWNSSAVTTTTAGDDAQTLSISPEMVVFLAQLSGSATAASSSQDADLYAQSAGAPQGPSSSTSSALSSSDAALLAQLQTDLADL